MHIVLNSYQNKAMYPQTNHPLYSDQSGQAWEYLCDKLWGLVLYHLHPTQAHVSHVFVHKS